MSQGYKDNDDLSERLLQTTRQLYSLLQGAVRVSQTTHQELSDLLAQLKEQTAKLQKEQDDYYND